MYYANGFGHMMGFGYGAGWMWFWGLLVITVGVFVVWSITRGTHGQEGHVVTPEEILKNRFARGEIEPEEYRTRLQELRR